MGYHVEDHGTDVLLVGEGGEDDGVVGVDDEDSDDFYAVDSDSETDEELSGDLAMYLRKLEGDDTPINVPKAFTDKQQRRQSVTAAAAHMKTMKSEWKNMAKEVKKKNEVKAVTSAANAALRAEQVRVRSQKNRDKKDRDRELEEVGAKLKKQQKVLMVR
ncbi:hypothetical protein PHYPSEUDO_000645 [Phytophthora pseudosyringae]|uniref:Uncharacterized protein n=1 Tax=Phytophthora pseudosyringae TaxID=221518 RepID=A0A8T1W0U8_9STRA|nr:hypothetical protein PHYPSEUDO_000645 [Phytophthora pseudosyringae]